MSGPIREVQILGMAFAVRADARAVMDRQCYGECNFHTSEITVDPRVSPAQQGETLVHEIVEALNHKLQIGLNQVRLSVLAVGLYQVLVTNPEAYGAIFKGEPIVAEEKS